VNIWQIIKDSVGKDLSKLTVPVYFNEPCSILQKSAEIMEYSELLSVANKTEDPVLRMIYVTIWSMTQYKCTLNRVSKPFNPILGETYELEGPNFQFVAEQVSHHPPVTACFA